MTTTLCDLCSFGDLTVYSGINFNYYDNYAYSLKSNVCNIIDIVECEAMLRKKEIQVKRKVKWISIITQKLFNYLFIAAYKRT